MDFDNIAYANRIQCERVQTWGLGSICQIFSVEHSGEQLITALTDFWTVRRTPNVETTQVEHWKLEIVADRIDFADLKSAAVVSVIPYPSYERRRFEVIQPPLRVRAGNVFQVKMVVMDEKVKHLKNPPGTTAVILPPETKGIDHELIQEKVGR